MKKLETLLRQAEKPARYTGSEINSVMKRPEDVNVRFAFAFPDIYEIGMSYVGLQILYDILNREEGVFCERVFAPGMDMETLMRRERVPLFSLETKTSLADFDIVGFTLQYELSFSNILNMLDLAGIPFRSSERNDDMPVIIAGGPCAFNPEPLADFIDLFVIGDGEEADTELCRLYDLCRREYPPDGNNTGFKRYFLEKAAGMEGIYVPGITDSKVRKNLIQDLDSLTYPEKPIVPFIETVHDRAVVEIFRGCTRGCRFCQAGMIYRPVRERRPETVKQLAAAQIKATGHDELSLLSLSSSDYSEFRPLVTDLMEICRSEDISLSLPSMRLDSFSFEVLREIQRYKKSGLTFAPEAGTQRLRNVINKSITDDDIYGAVTKAIELGWRQIKLYFMVGLPTETQKDLDGITEIVRRILDINYGINGRKGGAFRVSVSVSNFVPKAHTPFQWTAQNTPEEFTAKHAYLRERLSGKNVNFNYHDAYISVLEAVFARGDRKCGTLLEAAWKNGCKFDGWSEHFNKKGWEKAFEDTGIRKEDYTVRKRSYDEILPWDLIDCSVSREFLISEANKAEEGRITEDCRDGCRDCGISSRMDCRPHKGNDRR